MGVLCTDGGPGMFDLYVGGICHAEYGLEMFNFICRGHFFALIWSCSG